MTGHGIVTRYPTRLEVPTAGGLVLIESPAPGYVLIVAPTDALTMSAADAERYAAALALVAEAADVTRDGAD